MSDELSLKSAETEVIESVEEDGFYYRTNHAMAGPFSLEDTNKIDFIGEVAARLQVEPEEVLKAHLRNSQRPITLEEVLSILSSTVKRDDPTKAVLFLTLLLTWTEEDQGNIGLQAESSTGKSYIPLEIIEYYPQEDVIIYGGASPTAFFHEAGKWDEERKAIIVDLEKKILVFLDQPHYMLLEKLRALLSHDRKELQYKITDKTEKRGLRTKTVIIRGYPSVIFCAAKFSIDEQEKTRLFLLSPETTDDKLTESLYLIAKKLGNRDTYRDNLSKDARRRWLKIRVQAIKTAGIRNIIIEDSDNICRRFIDSHKHLVPRYQRDFPRLIGLIKGHALLNWNHREQLADHCINASQEDIEAGLRLYEQIATPNELGISPRIYEVYEQVLVPLFKTGNPGGLDKRDILGAFRQSYHRSLSYEILRKEIIPTLEGAGLVYEEPDPDDKRRMLVYPTDVSPISEAGSGKYRESVRGVDSYNDTQVPKGGQSGN